MYNLNKKWNELLARGRPKEKLGLVWNSLKKYLTKIFGESIDAALKKLISGGILLVLGAVGLYLYQQWDPEKVPVVIVGIVVDEAGLPINDANVRAKEITGITQSDEKGEFRDTVQIVKTAEFITFYCDKTGYITSDNIREMTKKNSPYTEKLKIIHVSFKLEKSPDSHVMND